MFHDSMVTILWQVFFPSYKKCFHAAGVFQPVECRVESVQDKSRKSVIGSKTGKAPSLAKILHYTKLILLKKCEIRIKNYYFGYVATVNITIKPLTNFHKVNLYTRLSAEDIRDAVLKGASYVY